MSAVPTTEPTVTDSWLTRYEAVVAPVLPGYFDVVAERAASSSSAR